MITLSITAHHFLTFAYCSYPGVKFIGFIGCHVDRTSMLVFLRVICINNLQKDEITQRKQGSKEAWKQGSKEAWKQGSKEARKQEARNKQPATRSH